MPACMIKGGNTYQVTAITWAAPGWWWTWPPVKSPNALITTYGATSHKIPTLAFNRSVSPAVSMISTLNSPGLGLEIMTLIVGGGRRKIRFGLAEMGRTFMGMF